MTALEEKQSETTLDIAFERLLVEAELAQQSGRNWEAVTLYDQAIVLAHEHRAAEFEALANELAGRFWLAKNKIDFARLHLQKAHEGYLRCSASYKAVDLAEQFPQLLNTNSDNLTLTPTNKPLDVKTILRVSQNIAGELVLEKLLVKLLETMIESMGAQRGLLIFDKAGQWVIEAESVADGPTSLFESKLVEPEQAEPLLPVSIIEYVAQTQETVTLSDAAHEDRFSQDRYIRAQRPKSILCTPFLTEIKLTGLLYLENDLVAGVFTPDKLELLPLLSTQAVISIETAILYATLESAMENQAVLANAYSRFVPPEILQYLGKESITQVKLGDQTQQEMTVLFSDIRSFTSLSEQMTPQENFEFINDYFGRVSPIIRQHRGFIDKYIGDAIMALFSGPTDEAVQAAIAMQQEVTRYNRQRRAQGRQSIRIGVGLHQGSVMLGTVGEVKRMEGTVISDAVNLASRLEGLTKIYGASIVVSEKTLFSLQRPTKYNFRFLDKVSIKGKTDQVSVFEIFDGDPEEVVELKLKTRPNFEKGLLHYHNHEFREAISYFNNVLELNPQDKAAQVYLRQATYCLWIGWEKVKILTEK
jgi:class 3 adenylate cyclase